MGLSKGRVWLCCVAGVTALLMACAVRADEFAAHRQQVAALADLTTAPAMTPAEGSVADGELRAIFFEGLPSRGKPTKVFAWLGVPKHRDGQLPGVVLVHGGGGTAFREWVERWNARGFAAISIAVEGQTDSKEPDSPFGSIATKWNKHADSGPQRSGIYHDSDQPLADQWMYHAVADTILANSLLRAQPGVDASTVGLMGISWGGVITSTVVGIDPRFAFAIPTYGCGDLAEAANQYGKALGQNAVYRQVWDPLLRLPRATMPILWFSWPQDKHFPLDALAACVAAAPGPHQVALVPGMGHGHGPPWQRPESYAFAEAVVTAGRPWCRQVAVSRTGQDGQVRFSSDKPLDRAVLVSTTDEGVTGSRAWRETPATLEQVDGCWLATATLPAGTTAWFINCFSGDLVTSSDYQEIGEPASSAGPPRVTSAARLRTGKRARVFSVIDTDGDGRIERQVYLDYYADVFRRLDKNGDGRLDAVEFARPTVRAAADADGDGSLTPAEFRTIFERQFSGLDGDVDGVVTKAEMLGQGD